MNRMRQTGCRREITFKLMNCYMLFRCCFLFAIPFLLVSCSTPQYVNVQPPIREVNVDFDGDQVVCVTTLFNGPPTVVSFPCPKIKAVYSVNGASSPNPTYDNTGFDLDFESCPGYVLIYAKKRNATGACVVDLGDGQTIKMKMTEISGIAGNPKKPIKADRTVVVTNYSNPIMVQWRANPRIPRTINLTCGGKSTTVMFPEPSIENVLGMNTTNDTAKYSADFLVYRSPDKYSLRITSLKQNAVGSLNVKYDGRIYVFTLRDVPRKYERLIPNTISFVYDH